jgi:hypothetical protein
VGKEGREDGDQIQRPASVSVKVIAAALPTSMRVRASILVLVKNCEENFPVLNRLVCCAVWYDGKKEVSQ